MNKKRFLIAIALSLAIGMVFFLYSSESISAMECRIINVGPGKMQQPVTIDPETLVASAGDCVVWFNNSGELIKITFKGSGDKCATPAGFFKSQQCFITSWYNHGSTTSIRLMEKGTYEYEVNARHEEVTKVIGKIEVK